MPKQIKWVIGWREWVILPDLDIPAIKAKIDTGARTSSLHAFALEPFRRQGRDYVRFEVHPLQRSAKGSVPVTAEVVEWRNVRSSSGAVEYRPTIRTHVLVEQRRWEIELTLTNRDEMGFRMLLGRQAVRDRFLIDPGKSFLAGSRPKTRSRKQLS